MWGLERVEDREVRIWLRAMDREDCRRHFEG